VPSTQIAASSLLLTLFPMMRFELPKTKMPSKTWESKIRFFSTLPPVFSNQTLTCEFPRTLSKTTTSLAGPSSPKTRTFVAENGHWFTETQGA
jgi:hypothetical protein